MFRHSRYSAIVHRSHLQPILLDQQSKAPGRIEIEVDAILFDVLITELVGQPKRIVIASICWSKVPCLW